MVDELLRGVYWLPRLARFLYEAATGRLSLRRTRRRELGLRDDRVAEALVARDGFIPEATVSASQMSVAPSSWPTDPRLTGALALGASPFRRRSAMDPTDKGPNGRPTRKP